jgi:multiple sugar transport system ATP-binding protein
MAEVVLEDVEKYYDDVEAVSSISFRVADGEFVVIVGPSGCGKSTTLRLIAGLESVTTGDVRLDDSSVVGVEPRDRDVAMVFQNYALYPHMTARRNITFGMKSAGSFTDDEIDARVEEAADVLDIADLLDRRPQALSGGERQRVALGRALVRDPEVFLLDEPLSNLDAKLRIKMRAELAKLHEEFGTTTVYVTHDQTEAMTLGDRVIVMNDGSVQQIAKPQTLYDFPANRFVAEFIGDPAMNMFPVHIEASGDGLEAVHGAFRIGLPGADGKESSLAAFVDDEALLGIRPENLSLAGEAGGDADSFPATVTVTEPLGDSLLLECTADETVCKVEAAPRTSVDPGDSVSLTWDSERLHVFDPAGGEAIYHSDDQYETEQSTTDPEHSADQLL